MSSLGNLLWPPYPAHFGKKKKSESDYKKRPFCFEHTSCPCCTAPSLIGDGSVVSTYFSTCWILEGELRSSGIRSLTRSSSTCDRTDGSIPVPGSTFWQIWRIDWMTDWLIHSMMGTVWLIGKLTDNKGQKQSITTNFFLIPVSSIS